MAHETAESTGERTTTGTVGRRRQLMFAGGIVGTFLLVGIGIGLAGRFHLEYMIGLFGAEDNPTANQYVGIVFLESFFVFLMAGIVLSGVAGLVTGLSFRGRLTAVLIGGSATLVGFLVMVFPALVVMVSILGGGGGGGGGGGPSLPTAAVLRSTVVACVVGGLSALVGSVIGN